MIAKHIPMRCASLSSFSGLVDYLTDTQNKDERVEAVNITNCISDTPAAAALEVRATQMRNTRARSDKTYHMLISFRAGENVELETLKKIEHEIVSDLGFGEHQRICVVHTDTDNLHMHIAINRVHPTTYRVHNPYYPYRTMAATCARIEREYGLAVDNHEATRSISAGRARDMEQHTGQESLIGWIKRENITEQMRGAATWQDLHNVLGEHGLVIKERGNGLVIATADGKVAVKASTIDRNLSKAKLTARLGEFEAAQGARKPAKKTYEKRPLGGQYTGALWARYKSETERNRTARRNGLSQLRTQRNQRQRDAIAANRKRRAQIKASDCDRIRKRSLYQQASASLGIERRRASAEYWNGRMALRAQTPILSWADWLRAEAQKGDKAALAALRARDAAVRKREANGIAPGWSGKLTLTEAYYECRERMAARHERERIELLANYRTRRAGLGGRNWQRDLSVLASQQVKARLNLKDRQRAESQKLLRIYTEAISAGKQITKTGTVIRNGLRDDGTAIRVSHGGGRKDIERAIVVARARSFGAPIVVTGDVRHKARVIVAAAKTDTALADAQLEAKRQEVMNGREGRYGGAGRSLGARDERGGSNYAAGRGAVHQPAARSYGRPPGDCLRTLRALDVEQVKARSAMLLPGHVRRGVEQPGADQPDRVRWTPAANATVTPQAQPQPAQPSATPPQPQQPPRSRGR